MKIWKVLVVFMLFKMSFLTLASNLDRTDTGFVYPIGKKVFDQECGIWLGRDHNNGGCYFDGKYHNGVDMMTRDSHGNNVSAAAYAIADGRIYKRHCTDDSWGPGNCALFIEHKTAGENSKIFTAVYGHLKKESLPKNDAVYAGQPIGKTGDWYGGIHLHFGIFMGNTPPGTKEGVRGWGMMSNSEWTNPCENDPKCTNGFIDPVNFIKTHDAYNPSVEVQAKCVGNACWFPPDVSCEGATDWYLLNDEPIASNAIRVGSYICPEVKDKLRAIIDNPHHEEEIGEDNWWRTWWRDHRHWFGSFADASTISESTVIRTINISQRRVVQGNGVEASHGTGVGYQTEAIEPEVAVPPDFVVERLSLEIPGGEESYRYALSDSFDTVAQIKNIGNGGCSGDITGHFYLSKGYKEDAHSGSDAWVRIDSTNTHCSNLGAGETHTEIKNTVISEWITEPGVYNVVYCIDHPQDDHNNGGDYPEKHESNNCSTEAAFEVGTLSVPASQNLIPRSHINTLLLF